MVKSYAFSIRLDGVESWTLEKGRSEGINDGQSYEYRLNSHTIAIFSDIQKI